MSKKLLAKGLLQELKHSKVFHQGSIPLLISPQILRSRNLGQLDLVKIYKKNGTWQLEVGEVKSSNTGNEASVRQQLKRITSGSSFLASILGFPVKLIKLVG